MSPLLGWPSRAPRSRPVYTPPGWGKAPRRPESRPEHRERPDRTRHGAPTLGHEARQRGTPPATTKTQGQFPSRDGQRVPQTRAAHTTRNDLRRRNKGQETSNQHAPKTQPKIAEYRQKVPSDTHTPTPQPGVAWRSRNASPNTHTHTAQPSQDSRGKGEAHAKRGIDPNTPAPSGLAQPKPVPKHTHPDSTSQASMAGYRRTNTHELQHHSQEWRGTGRGRTPADTPQHPDLEWWGAAET